MDAMSEIFLNPSFKKDFAFIKQLEAHNKNLQDKIWERFADPYSKRKDNARIVNTRFESHPSGLSSDSETSIPDIEDALSDEPKFQFSSGSFNLKNSREKEKDRSSSASKITMNEVNRKKLRKKLTQHLKDGTLNQFEIRDIGDHPTNNRKLKEEERKEKTEVYLDHWKRPEDSEASTSSRSSPNTLSKENIAEAIDLPSRPQSPEKISENMQGETKRTKPPQKVKPKLKKGEEKAVQAKTIKKVSGVSISAELRKSRHYIEKCIGIIKDIGLILNRGTVPPDGTDDYARRHARTKAFTSRFNRIYMYPLVRLLSEINTLEMEKEPLYHSKFTAMYQLIYQALLACFHHFPSTVGISSYHKLKEHLSCTIEVCDKNNKYFHKEINYDNEDYISILKSQCVDLIHRLDDNFLSTSIDSLLKSRSTRATLVPVTQSNKTVALIPMTKGTCREDSRCITLV
ncbi:hypothetical protein HHI36_015172 [Cryptolaemus montrouzieri]|uniref:Uncharacterized protein n=1 Tax=Cryptolaemus montrouzieri TaxID=559131 RepID=A0ABD2N5C2_9CUCU